MNVYLPTMDDNLGNQNVKLMNALVKKPVYSNRNVA
jgi:hypothetical protein